MTAVGDPAARAAALVDLGRPAEALPLIHKLIAEDPENARHRCVLSLALLKNGDAYGADAAACEAIGLDPENEWPHRLRALALNAVGRAPEAVYCARQSVALAPRMAAPYTVLIEAARSAHDPALAEQAARELVGIAPSWANSHYFLGKVDLDAQRNAEAVPHLREALRLDPEMRVAHNDLGVALLRLGDRRQALQAFQAAVQLDPRDQTAINNIRVIARQNRVPLPKWSRKHLILVLPGFLVAGFRRIVRRGDMDMLPAAARRDIGRFSGREKLKLFLIPMAAFSFLAGIASYVFASFGPGVESGFGGLGLLLILAAFGMIVLTRVL